MTGRLVLELELELALVLVTMVEEFAVLDTALEVKLDDVIADTETLELDRLLRLEVVKILDELEIGYKTLLELDSLFELEVRAEVVLSLGLETTALDGERLVDTTDERVDPEGLVNAEELLDLERLDNAVLDDAVGLKMTIAKI
jgi:hypothetical protein